MCVIGSGSLRCGDYIILRTPNEASPPLFQLFEQPHEMLSIKAVPLQTSFCEKWQSLFSAQKV